VWCQDLSTTHILAHPVQWFTHTEAVSLILSWPTQAGGDSCLPWSCVRTGAR
jgi:hypothetical protein